MAKIEVNKYKKSRNEEWLYQAAEKVWAAYVLFIEHLSKTELKSRRDIDAMSWKLIRQGKILEQVYEKANNLHVYHYEGRTSIPFILNYIDFVSKYIRSRVV